MVRSGRATASMRPLSHTWLRSTNWYVEMRAAMHAWHDCVGRSAGGHIILDVRNISNRFREIAILCRRGRQDAVCKNGNGTDGRTASAGTSSSAAMIQQRTTVLYMGHTSNLTGFTACTESESSIRQHSCAKAIADTLYAVDFTGLRTPLLITNFALSEL
jgi:hypothetical protein